jgi:hypothetical protein
MVSFIERASRHLGKDIRDLRSRFGSVREYLWFAERLQPGPSGMGVARGCDWKHVAIPS